MTSHTFHGITSPIVAFNPLGFPNTTRSDRPNSCVKSTRIPKYNVKRSIQSADSIHNLFRHDLTHLSCDHEPHLSIKSTRIPKYNVKRSFSLTSATTHLNLFFLSSFEIQSRHSIQNMFRHDLTHLPFDHERHHNIKSTRISKYNGKRSDMTLLLCDHETNSSIKSTRIPTYNAKRSFSLTCATTRLNLYCLSSFETQSQFSIHNVVRQDLTHLPCDHEHNLSIKSTRIPKYNAKRSDLTHLSCDHNPHSSIKSTRIPKYNGKRSDLTHLPYDHNPNSSIKSTRIPKYNGKRSDLTHLPCDHNPNSSIKSTRIPKYNGKRSIQSRFSIQNVFRHDLAHLPCDHEAHSSIKSTRIPKYNAKRSFSLSCATTRLNLHDLTHLPRDHKAHSSNKSTGIPKYNAKRSFSLTCATTRLNLYFLTSFEIQSRFSIQNVFRHDLAHLPCDHEAHSSIKSTWIPKYNVKRSFSFSCATTHLNLQDLTHLPCNHEHHSSIKSSRAPKYNAERSFSLTYARTRLNLYFLSSFEIQSRFLIQNVFRYDLTHLPRDNEPHSRIKSTRIPKYNAKRSFSLTCATTRLNLYFLSSFKIQSRFSIQNVFKHELTHLRCDHDPNSSIKSSRIPKYKTKR
ncbi:hypothetical protein G2W53_027042 [Senna tora]|uniref:Uncharacterized protein n=1 Tax=Senna tora TaxID=362788 RepID=A0A834WG76_9FABA|nr:hypothetical protein G2W53_027042 [Senna tora]